MGTNTNGKMRSAISKNKSLISSEFSQKLIEAIDLAQKNIEIVMFEWRWYENEPANKMQLINNALVRAVRRGVLVRAITSHAHIVDILNSVGIKAKKLKSSRLLHSKLIIFDSSSFCLGSHNFTLSAMQSNIETSLIVHDDLVGQNYVNFFNNLWQS